MVSEAHVAAAAGAAVVVVAGGNRIDRRTVGCCRGAEGRRSRTREARVVETDGDLVRSGAARAASNAAFSLHLITRRIASMHMYAASPVADER